VTLTTKKKMPVMEIFGPTIQGEGMVIGRKTMFLRTGGCDYSCDWCDSAFTWNGHEKANKMTAEEVFDEIVAQGADNFDHVTISGGNPALWQEPMDELIDLIHENGLKAGLETQGSIWRDWFLKIDDLTISPKPPSSKMITRFEVLDNMVARLEEAGVNFSLKVVVFDDADFEYAKMINLRYHPEIFYVSVGNADPYEQGDVSGRLLETLGWLWDKVLADPYMNNIRPFPQLHTLVWANKRGV
jgi:7-carboxy-7-deazaguanine synthase